MKPRILTVSTAVVLVSAITVVTAADVSHADRPNIVFIPADDLGPPSVVVHQKEWKLIRIFHGGKNGVHRWKLFNLRDDIGEKNDLAANEPDRVKAMDLLIEHFLADTNAVQPVRNPEFDPAVFHPEDEGHPKPRSKPKSNDNAKSKPKTATTNNFAAVLSATASTAVGQSSAAPPNMLIILADDLGYADLQCCGSKDLRTPHLNELFRAGMKFTNAYANCPVCSPTRAALLSGRYQDVVGVPGVIRTHPEDSWGYLSPNIELLPSVARKSGYQTAIVGKWHLGLDSPNTPTERGFEVFHGFLGDMMDNYYHHRRHDVNYMRNGDKVIDPEGHATDLFSDWAVEFLNEQANAKNPFLLYLACNAPHTPIQPPDAWLQEVQQREPGITPVRARLVALIEHMDDGIGKVIAALKRNGQWQNTIIVFTSDNGGQPDAGANNGPLRDGKQSVYEGGLKVPMCVVWPDHVQPETETPFTAMSMDILPTLFQAANIVAPKDLDGRSFLPTLYGDTQPALRNQWFFTRREGGLRYGGKTIEAIRDGDWKLLQNLPFEPLELYNLSVDPYEKTDIAKQNRPVVHRLNAALRLHLQRGGAVPWQPPENE